MKTSEIPKSSHHQQQRSRSDSCGVSLKSEQPFFSSDPKHAFFSTQRVAPTPFFQPQPSSTVALQTKPVDGDGEKLNQEAVEEPETPTLQRIQEFASDNNQVQPPREHPLLTLQRKLGNRAVTQMIQAKLTVGKANDHYEQEADRVANTVMRMPDPLVQRQSGDKKEEIAQMRSQVVPISRLVQRQVDKQEEPAQAKSLIGSITPVAQRQTAEEKKDETAQMLQRQAEEKKEESIQTLQRQAEEKKEEPIQTLQRQTTEENQEEPVQTKEIASATPQVSTNVESNIQGMRGGGQPLEDSTRTFFESRFGYDFGGVRVHTGTNASEAANSLNAQAFTVGQDIFFNSGRYEPQTSNGKWLLAHELTHTVQQQPQPQSIPNNSEQATATPSAQDCQRKPLPLSTTSPQIQRFDFGLPGIDTVRNWAADRAANIPGFTMLTVILGRNPINNRPVEPNPTNLIRGALGLVPGGELIFQGLQASGAIAPVATWLQQQIAQLNISWENIVGLFSQALRSLSARDILDIGGAAERILNIFRPTLERIRAFAAGVGRRVIQFIKEAILRPVGQFAQGLPFYPLLTVILNKDPITDEFVERNATTVIRGILMILPGGEEKFQNLQRSGIIDRAYNWFNEQLTRLNLTWNYIKSIFVRLWETLSIRDILSPLAAFERIRNIFSEPVRRITTFAGAAVRKVAEFIFEGVLTLAGGLGRQVLNIFNQARSVLSTIIENPIGFIGNLVNSVKRGFQQFASNILTHLRGGLIGWLFGALAGAGLQLPERFDLRGIVSLVMQILGLTYQRLRGILVRLLGSEERVQRAEQAFDFLVTLVRDGIAAAWQRIVEFVGNLQEMVIGGIRDWVARTVVGQAIARLVTLFNPAGAVIQAIMAIYNTIVFFIERAQQISAVVESVFGSIASIAAGNIGAAANLVERTMARTIPVILGFLARFIGLGNVGEQIQNVIRRIQAPIERAMERVASWIAERVRGLLGRGEQRGTAASPEIQQRWLRGMQSVEILKTRTQSERFSPEQLQTALDQIKTDYGFRELRPFPHGQEMRVHAIMNPDEEVDGLRVYSGFDAHLLVGSERHHAFFGFLRRAIRAATSASNSPGLGTTSQGRLRPQRLVPLGTATHQELHALWDQLSSPGGPYEGLGRGMGASRRVAELIRSGEWTPTSIADALENFYTVALIDYPQERDAILNEVRRIRDLTGI